MLERSYTDLALRQAMALLAIDSPTGFTEKAARWVQDAFAALGYDARRTAKGGVLVAITQMRPENPLPIYFIGVGEAIDDLQPFNAVQFANALVGLDPNTPATAPE